MKEGCRRCRELHENTFKPICVWLQLENRQLKYKQMTPVPLDCFQQFLINQMFHVYVFISMAFLSAAVHLT